MINIVVKLDEKNLSSPEQIGETAKRLIEEKKFGRNVVAVVPPTSLLNGSVEKIVHSLSDSPAEKELDVIHSTNALVASSLLSIAIQKRGFRSQSLAGWQVGIKTTRKTSGYARIEDVNGDVIIERFKKGEIVIVAGGQGVDEENNITLLGEGGADTTAVAIGKSIGAERVEIYAELDGVYTGDPNVVQHARKLKDITYDEMLELSYLGSKIVHPRAVELAKKFEMPLVVRSSTKNVRGTVIKGEIEMEKNLIVRGVAYETDIIRFTVGYETLEKSSLANLFNTLAKHHVNVDIIVQSVMEEVKPTISFSIAKEDLANAVKVLEDHKEELGFQFADFEVGLAKVSIVGSGMVSNPGVAAKMFARLCKENIPVKMVSTSEIKVSVVVPQDDMIRAANALHDEFGLAEELA
ncbi:aspartate kinase [Ureibacillus sp. FSL K6-8385]|uniref:Aspartokinase n=1 Tax=Ureibacillus terrenus TaxID=118246 RepID=A0A540V1P0_9BACL|nr:aspartate kinase [Ureibacillus terrenus]MED3662004.1 aspartate kinase [Ureibacillus terrenus]MED3764733.1 aspartate kinase [Ureibacillus terrenus]TQE90631.1 aspartate kinase [Ureibacillus terrenus]